MTTVISQPIGKLSIFSEYGYDKFELDDDFDDKPMELKVTKVKIEEKLMPENQTDSIKTRINSAVEVAHACLEIKKSLLEDDKAKSKLTAIQGVGDIIKGVIKLVPGGPNPVVEKLKALDNEIEKLEERVNDGFDEVKAFITEVKFIINIMCPTAVLTKCMRDCLKNPSHEAVRNFRMVYKSNTPVKIAYNLMGLFEQSSTNPLKRAMGNEKSRWMATFRRWDHIISNILEHFLILEAFAIGLLGTGTTFHRDLLLSRSQDISKIMKDWSEEYFGKVGDYWKEMKEFLGPYLGRSTGLTNQQKAKEIKVKLDSYYTEDSFYVFIFDECRMNQDVTFYCPKASDNLIESYDKGKCNVIICRSRTANQKNESDFKKLQQELEANRKTLKHTALLKILSIHYLDDMLKKQFVEKGILKDYGFLCIINKTKNVAVESSNCYKNGDGPGAVDTAEVAISLLLRKYTENFVSCAAFE